MSLLEIRGLTVDFRQDGREMPAVRNVSFHVGAGETVAVVGESGSGKSVTALATVDLLPESAVARGSVLYQGEEMIGAPEDRLQRIRGNDISFIFQEPMTSLNPLHTIEKQLGESLSVHQGLRGQPLQDRIVELLGKVGIPDEQLTQKITSVMISYGFGPIMFLIIVNIILLIGGQFMEPSGLLVIVAPLVFPIAMELGIDPIHLGIIMVVNMEIGMITPPVGLNLFVTAGVANMSMMGVVRAALPFLAIMFVFLILITYVPWISTVLPNSVMGPEIIMK